MSNPPKPATVPDPDPVLQHLATLTEAIRDIAEKLPTPQPVADTSGSTAAQRTRERVDFDYRVLATLTGRTSSTVGRDFDVPVVGAGRTSATRVELTGLPADGAVAELRGGGKKESLPINRAVVTGSGGAASGGGATDSGSVSPALIPADKAIDSILILRTHDEGLLAIGPRLPPLP